MLVVHIRETLPSSSIIFIIVLGTIKHSLVGGGSFYFMIYNIIFLIHFYDIIWIFPFLCVLCDGKFGYWLFWAHVYIYGYCPCQAYILMDMLLALSEPTLLCWFKFAIVGPVLCACYHLIPIYVFFLLIFGLEDVSLDYIHHSIWLV